MGLLHNRNDIVPSAWDIHDASAENTSSLETLSNTCRIAPIDNSKLRDECVDNLVSRYLTDIWGTALAFCNSRHEIPI